MSHGAMLLGLALITGATGVVCMRTDRFSHGFGLTSLALALLSLAGAFTIGYASDPIQAVAGVTILLDSVWIAVVSFFLWRRADTTG